MEVDDEKKYRIFFEKRISEEVNADALGDQYKGYILKITGGLDKQGFAMRQGVLTSNRVRLLLNGKTGHYVNRRVGDRRRKSVRGCIVSSEMSVINCVIVKKGEAELEGLTDVSLPHRLGPKRANHIRKFFNLSKEDDVRRYVIQRIIPGKDGKKDRKVSPKIQRLITPVSLRRKRQKLNQKKARFAKQLTEKSEYEKMMAQINQEKRQTLLTKKRTDKKSAKENVDGAEKVDSAKKVENVEKTAQKTSAKSKPAQKK